MVGADGAKQLLQLRGQAVMQGCSGHTFLYLLRQRRTPEVVKSWWPQRAANPSMSASLAYQVAFEDSYFSC